MFSCAILSAKDIAASNFSTRADPLDPGRGRPSSPHPAAAKAPAPAPATKPLRLIMLGSPWRSTG
ncbi:hypothetical protein GCM10009745_31830 [Kribbella yunnanensis]|uniref:Uncharacterized protein n=1 Tax=Kribbella yunnanensis TaxID=190194 RepID=A0ABN2HBB0_9ACTN